MPRTAYEGVETIVEKRMEELGMLENEIAKLEAELGGITRVEPAK